MAGLSEQEKATIRADLKSAKYSDAEIESVVSDMDASAGGQAPPGEDLAYHSGPTAIKTLVPMLGAGVGGSLGRAALGRVLGRPIAAALGEWTGGSGAMVATGTPPGRAIKAGLLPALIGGGVEGGMNVGSRVLGQASGVPEEAVEGALSRGPIGAGRVTRFGHILRGQMAPAKGAEDALAGNILNRATTERAGTFVPQPAILPPMIRTPVNRLRQAFGAEPLEPPAEPLGSAMDRAMEAVRSVPGEIDTAPIRAKIGSLMRKPLKPVTRGALGRMEAAKLATPQEEAANAALQDAAGRLPAKFQSLEAMEDYLQRIREPISGTFGEQTPRLTIQDAKAIQASVRELRDQILGGPESEGAQAFAQASDRQKALTAVEKMLRDRGGALRETAGRKIARAGAGKGEESLRRIDALDPDLARQVEELALQRQWTGPRQALSLGRLAMRPGSKTFAVLSRPAGQVAAAATMYRQALDAQRADELSSP